MQVLVLSTAVSDGDLEHGIVSTVHVYPYVQGKVFFSGYISHYKVHVYLHSPILGWTYPCSIVTSQQDSCMATAKIHETYIKFV